MAATLTRTAWMPVSIMAWSRSAWGCLHKYAKDTRPSRLHAYTPMMSKKHVNADGLCQRVVRVKPALLHRRAFGPPEGARSKTPLPHTPEKPHS